jgi:hypothetical protein
MTDNYDDSTDRTAPAPATTLVQPAVVDEAPARRPRSSVSIALRLMALIFGVAIAGGLTVYLILGGEDKPPAQPAAVLPKPDNVLPTDEAGSAPARTSPSAKVSSSASPSASASASASVSATRSKPQQQATSPAGSKPTLEGPPAADRSGKVTAASGRCLMRGGLLGVDGSPIQVADCGVASTFTLAADGTLRVNGRCAQVSGDGTVRIDGCGGQDSAQWRRGPGSSLVNPSSGHCLTDPGRAGATTQAAACTGGSEQHWSLP